MRIDRRVTDLYNEYVHTSLPRREFVARLARITGGVAAAVGLLPLLEPDYAHARQVEESDARLATRRIAYPGTGPLRRGRGASRLEPDGGLLRRVPEALISRQPEARRQSQSAPSG